MAPRLTSLLTCGLLLLSLPWLAGGSELVVPGLGLYEYADPNFEGMRLILTQRGEAYSAAYIQGLSGSAFRMAGPCPCAPTCSRAMTPTELAERLGYMVEELGLPGGQAEVNAAAPAVVTRVKQALREGQSALVWSAFSNAEWDVVCGADEESDEFLGRSSYSFLGMPDLDRKSVV